MNTIHWTIQTSMQTPKRRSALQRKPVTDMQSQPKIKHLNHFEEHDSEPPTTSTTAGTTSTTAGTTSNNAHFMFALKCEPNRVHTMKARTADKLKRCDPQQITWHWQELKRKQGHSHRFRLRLLAHNQHTTPIANACAQHLSAHRPHIGRT